MEQFMCIKIRSCCSALTLASVICAIFFQGVSCQENTTTLHILSVKSRMPELQNAPVRGDDVQPTEAHKPQIQVEVFPILEDDILRQSAVTPETAQDWTTRSSESNTVTELDEQQDTKAPQHITTNQPIAEQSITHTGPVVCVDEAAVRGKEAVSLKLKALSSCEENRVKIQSILEHLCGDDSKLEIYQRDHTDEMIISGQCIQDAKGMTDKFNNDNIKDKVGVVEAVPILVKHSRTVLISVLLSGLLLAALLIAAYVLKTHRTQNKGVRLAEEMYQVDEQNQGNTLLSVAPLPPQEPLDKPTSNGESPESPPPTNGHSAPQTQVADSQM